MLDKLKGTVDSELLASVFANKLHHPGLGIWTNSMNYSTFDKIFLK
jgi:hypothetical protein